MHACKPLPATIVKGDSFREFQCPRNQYETDQMKAVPYSSVIGSLLYAQVCTHPDLAFVTGLLGRYLRNRTLKISKESFALPVRYEGFHAKLQKI